MSVYIKEYSCILYAVKGRPHLQGVPLKKTVHWTVFLIHPCGDSL